MSCPTLDLMGLCVYKIAENPWLHSLDRLPVEIRIQIHDSYAQIRLLKLSAGTRNRDDIAKAKNFTTQVKFDLLQKPSLRYLFYRHVKLLDSNTIAT